MKALLLTIGLLGGGAVLGRNLYATLTSNGPEPTLSYYSDGQKKASFQFVDGVKQGASEQWHSNGQQEARGSYTEGLRDGAWTFWTEDGSIDAERSGEYRGGRLITGN